jgi:hypothetical protein
MNAKRFLRWVAADHSLGTRQGWLLWGILGAGAILRLQQWFFCRSLWLDEAKLALNIQNRSFIELLSPLDYNQGAAVGFLWVQAGLVSVFSDHEMVLRVFPLLAGIASLFIFSRLVFSIFSGPAPWIALAWLVLNDRQIYYSNEAKQYGLDVFLTLLLLLLAVQILRSAKKEPSVWPLGLLGFLAIWFSHPVVFVLAGIGLVWSWARWKKILSVSWLRLTAVGVLWVAGFLLSVWVSLSGLMANAMLQEYWQSAYPPWFWPEGLLWFGRSIAEFFLDPASLVPGLALPLFVLGAVILIRQNGKHAALLLLPFGFTLLAAGLHLYPFQKRLVLFLAPVTLLLTANCLGVLGRFCARRWGRYRKLVWVVVGLLVLGVSWDSLRRTVRWVGDPQVREHIRPLLVQLKQMWQPGDRLYVYRHAWAPYRYYQKRLGLDHLDWVQGSGDRKRVGHFEKDWRRFQNAPRVWVLVSHSNRFPLKGSPNENAYILKKFSRLGPRRWHRRIPGSSLTLFEVAVKESSEPI